VPSRSTLPRTEAKADGGLNGERRHLTVLFCELVRPTTIAIQLDPRSGARRWRAYHRVTAEAIIRFDGHVVKHLGDGSWLISAGPQRVTMRPSVLPAQAAQSSTPSQSSTNDPRKQSYPHGSVSIRERWWLVRRFSFGQYGA
jgi:class 3 adenylate cyclase